MAKLTVEKFYVDTKEKLKLELLNNNASFHRIIEEGDLHRPGLALSGFVDVFTHKRIQIIGNTENSYLKKLSTPEWILGGYDSEAEYNKAKGIKKEKKKRKTFSIRECPKCESDDVGVLLGGEEGKGSKGWQCHKCGWKGTDINEKELTEDELMAYMDKKGEEIA